MQEIIKKYEKKIQDKNAKRRKLKIVTAIASLAVVCIVLWALILPGVAMSGQPKCGKEEHRHSDACYTEKLTCGQKETDGHTHTDACYKTEKKLICGQEESETHQHTDACYQEEKTLICGKQEEAAHHHTAACYTRELTCGKEEHTHTDECYSDPTADVENEDSWTTTFRHAELGDDWGKNVAAIAETQIGYRESSNNYSVSENREHKGYTRYTAWYGDYYKDWDTAFAAFCIHYAGVPDDAFPTDIKADEWIKKLQEKDWYADKTSEDYQVGDLIFLHKKNQETDTQVGVISKIFEKDGKTYIQTIEGNCDNQVKKNEYAADDENISGYGLLCKAQMKYKADQMAQENAKSEAKARKAAARKTSAPVQTQVADEGDGEDSAVFYSDENANNNIRATGGSNEIDFSQYITKATISELKNGAWEEITDGKVEIGDQIRVALNYKLPSGIISEENNVISYQLSDSIHPIENMSGTVYDTENGQKIPVGTYEIGTDGKIKITFNKDYAKGSNGYTGDLFFEGTVQESKNNTSGKIDFGGDAGSITIEKKKDQKDISISKKATYDKNTKKASYTITVASTNGSQGTIDVTDAFGNGSLRANGKYEKNTFKVIKRTKGSNEEGKAVSSDQYKLTIKEGDNDSFEIKNLPQLGKNEEYVITYQANISTTTDKGDGSSKIGNVAKADSGSDHKESWNTVEISKSKIYKTGYYDTNKDEIVWEVTINNPEGVDISGKVFSDELPEDYIEGSWTINPNPSKDTSPKITDNKKIEYTFPTGSKATSYQIKYRTKAPKVDPGKSAKVKNKAGFDGNTSEAEASVTGRDWGLKKELTGNVTQTKDNEAVCNWKAIVTLPNTELESFTYTDTIQNALGSDDQDEGNDSHYGIKKEIEEKIKETLILKTKDKDLKFNNENFKIELKFYSDLDHTNEVTSDDAKVKSFKVIVTPKNNSQKGSELSFVYPTHAKYSMDEGEKWTYKNSGKLNELTTEAKHEYTKPKTIEKSEVNQDGMHIWSDGSAVDYDSSSGILTYRVLLRTKKDQNGEITLTDTLQPNMRYVENSIKGYFYANDYFYWEKDGNYDFNDSKVSVAVSDITNTDGKTSQQLKIKIAEGYNASNNSAEGRVIGIQYQISVKDDPFWADLSNESKTYENHIEWDGKSDIDKTEVNRDVDKVKKKYEAVQDEQGNVTGVKYNVIINPAGVKLNTDPNKNTLTLEDTLSISEKVFADLDMNTVKLYYYDGTKENGHGAEISKSRYKVKYDATQHKLTVEIPDELACVLEYRYNTSLENVQSTEIGNSVTLSGVYTDETKNKVNASSSGSTVRTDTDVNIYKVDSENYELRLSGAEFELCEATDSGFANPKKYTTNADGKFVLSEGNKEITENVLYRLEEKKAPTNYEKTGDYKYFILLPSGKSLNDVWNQIPWSCRNGLDQKDVLVLSRNGGNIYIPNKSTVVTAEKVWTDTDGKEIQDTDDLPNINVQLYKQEWKQYNITLEAGYKYYDWEGNPVEVIENSYPTFSIAQESKIRLQIPADPGQKSEIEVKMGGTSRIYTKDDITTLDKGNFGFILNITPQEDLNIKVYKLGGYVATDIKTYWTIDYEKPNELTPKVPVGESKTLTKTNNWKTDWKNLDSNYFYSVEEVGTPSGYQASYVNNAGIKHGVITITNQKTKESYRLPSTGGTGTTGYLAGGAALMCLAALLYGYQLRRKRERGTM